MPPPRPPPRPVDSELARAIAEAIDQAQPDQPQVTRPPAQGPWRAGVALISAVAVCLAFDSEGLISWARRLDAGPGQRQVLQVLTPIHALAPVQPRRWLAEHAMHEGDALLARGWVTVDAPMQPAPVAPTSPSPPLPEPVRVEPLAPPAAVAERGVLLLGDSMMAGNLGATLERALARTTELPVHRAAQLGTGLARPDLYDWMAVIPPLLARERPRWVVVSLGANDGTALRDGERTIDFHEARWREVYGERVEAVMRALAGPETRVLWLLLPPMRDPRLQSRMAVLNGVFHQRARRVPGVEVLELDPILSNDDRQYATFVQTSDGRLSRYRLDDGVHLAPAGSRVVAKWVQDWVRERQAHER